VVNHESWVCMHTHGCAHTHLHSQRIEKSQYTVRCAPVHSISGVGRVYMSERRYIPTGSPPETSAHLHTPMV
jgi:hypothetical protein